jgi:two-component system chemotaxis sensor kinase CheA
MSQGHAIVHDGHMIPLASLARTLVRESLSPRTSGPATVLIIQGRTSSAALRVDRIVGITNVVLRPLPALAPAAPFVAGASLDAEGAPQLVIDADALVSAIERMESPGEESEATRLPLLVIDDSLTTRMLEQSILESAGYAVDVAMSGEEGFEKARQGRHALFLVDVEMPGMDGFAFIERVRADPDLRHVPSILVTSRSSPEDQRRGHEVGAQAYIIKGEFDQGVLLDHIRRLVG